MERIKMNKYDFIKCMNLHKRLKDKIKGRVFLSIENDNMTININAIKGIKYKSYINDVPKQISNYDFWAEQILDDYKKYIFETFFVLENN